MVEYASIRRPKPLPSSGRLCLLHLGLVECSSVQFAAINKDLKRRNILWVAPVHDKHRGMDLVLQLKEYVKCRAVAKAL